MKKLILLLVLALFYYQANAQLAVGFHRSYLPFVGVNYQIGDRFIPNYRIAVNNLNSETAMQLALSYVIKQQEHYQIYGGLAAHYFKEETTLGISGGMNLYPFKTKGLGFHLEVTTLFDRDGILRGGWGLQYRFIKNQKD
jgi:hypothetical protein